MEHTVFCADTQSFFCTEKCHMAFHGWLEDGEHGSGTSDDQEKSDGSGEYQRAGAQSSSISGECESTDEDSVSFVWFARDVNSHRNQDRS